MMGRTDLGDQASHLLKTRNPRTAACAVASPPPEQRDGIVPLGWDCPICVIYWDPRRVSSRSGKRTIWKITIHICLCSMRWCDPPPSIWSPFRWPWPLSDQSGRGTVRGDQVLCSAVFENIFYSMLFTFNASFYSSEKVLSWRQIVCAKLGGILLEGANSFSWRGYYLVFLSDLQMRFGDEVYTEFILILPPPSF